jgi:hypothetical protein
MANVNIVLQPQTFLVTEGTTVTFSTSGSLLGTSLSGETIVYQWLSSGDSGVNFGNIPSATDSSYTVTAVRSLDNYVYKASLSASGVESAVFTNNATLAIRLTGDIYAPWEVGIESGKNRFRRLWTMGYV